MRILLTGAAGFIGSHLSDRLVADCHSLLGVDNLSSGRLSNLAQLRAAERFEFVEADAALPLSVRGPFDWVMHFASPASPPRYRRDPIATLMGVSSGAMTLFHSKDDIGFLSRKSGRGGGRKSPLSGRERKGAQLA